jgi:multidrug efflux pump subunit AcrA (membrane-fusion protein)
MYLAEYPGRAFPAVLDSTANALDPAARTLLVEMRIDNPDGLLKPGGFCEVHIELPSAANDVRLPVSTLLFRADGLHVAVLGPGNKAILKPVTISRDFGNEIEFSTGVAPGDTVILNPPDSLVDGEPVRVVTPQKPGNPNDTKEGKSP